MKLKLFVFLLFISISVSGQINGSAGYFNYLEPTRGFEVNIEIKYNLREAFGEVALTASFETSPARGGFRYYFYNGKRYNLVDYGIYINYNKIITVDALLDVSISTQSKNINLTSLRRGDPSGSGTLLCREFGFSSEICEKYKNNLSSINVRLISVKVNTRDLEIERKLDKWLNDQDGDGPGGTDNGPGGTDNGPGGTDNGPGNGPGGTDNGPGNDPGPRKGPGKGDVPDTTPKKKKLERRPFDEIPDDEYVPPLDGTGRKMKKETNNSNKKPNGDNPKPIYNEPDWGVKAPVAKIVIKKTSNNNRIKKTNNANSISKTKRPINKASINNENAKKYYTSAFDNVNKGDYSKAIKDLELQKAYTSDPVERAKINSNIESVQSRIEYQNYQTKVSQKIERDNYLDQQSLDFTNKIDAASNGDHLMDASQKFGYALGSAIGGRIDVNSIAGGATSLISYFGNKKKEKEALEAQKRAIKQKIAEENRKRELERQKYLNGLKRERRIVTKDLPKYSYPNYLTDETVSTYYYFVIYTNQDILNTDYPEADITDIVDVKKYKDGTWPFENDFKASLQKLSSKPIKHIIGYTDYEIAAGKLGSIIKGFGRGGVKLSFIKASKENTKEADPIENTNDFWGEKISNEAEVNKAPSKQNELEEGEDYWGKSVKLKNKVNPVKKETPSKKKDFWGKTIEIKD